MNDVMIHGTGIEMKYYREKPVITFKDIDAVHKRPDGTARKRFNDNRKHFVNGVDFYNIDQPSEIRTLGIERPQGGYPDKVILITETGYLMLVKSFTDDLAWAVQRELVESYFRRRVRRRTDVEVEQKVTVTQAVPENPEIFLEAARIMATIPDSKPYVINCLRHVVDDIDSNVKENAPDTLKTAVEVKQTVKFVKVGVPCDIPKFKKSMKKKNLSASKVAAKAGVSVSTVSNILAGKNRPTIETRTKLCMALGEPEDFLSI